LSAESDVPEGRRLTGTAKKFMLRFITDIEICLLVIKAVSVSGFFCQYNKRRIYDVNRVQVEKSFHLHEGKISVATDKQLLRERSLLIREESRACTNVAGAVQNIYASYLVPPGTNVQSLTSSTIKIQKRTFMSLID